MDTQQIIDFNEKDFEENIYDFYTFMLYKGQPFTGKLRDGNSIIEYKDGNADGLSVSFFPNGQISSEAEYKDGEFVGGKDWYENGQLMSTCLENESFKYAKNGSVAYEYKSGISTWYYSNGAVKEVKNQHSWSEIYYAPNGQILIEIEKSKNIRYATFYDDALIANYKELITDSYPELKHLSSSNDGHYQFPELCFQLWVLKLISEQPTLGLQILKELECFPDSYIKHIAKTIKMHSTDFRLKEVAKASWGYCGYKIKTIANSGLHQWLGLGFISKRQ